MSARRWGLALVAVTAGCAPMPRSVSVEQARDALIGRPAASITACMGPAPVQRTRGSVVLLAYPSATATAAAPVTLADPASADFQYTPFGGDPLGGGLATSPLGVSEGPAAPSGCIVDITLDGGVVRAVTYVGPNGHLLRQDRECSGLVRECLRG